MDAAARAALKEDVMRLRDGDRGASRAVFSALWPAALAYARAQLGNDADAHDAAQQGLIKLFAQVTAYDEGRSPLGWALALVTWECRTLRTQRRRRRVDDGADVSAVATNAPDLDDVIGDRLEKSVEVARVAAGIIALDDVDQRTLRAMLDGEAAGAPRDRKRRQRALSRLKALVFGVPLEPAGDDHV